MNRKPTTSFSDQGVHAPFLALFSLIISVVMWLLLDEVDELCVGCASDAGHPSRWQDELSKDRSLVWNKKGKCSSVKERASISCPNPVEKECRGGDVELPSGLLKKLPSWLIPFRVWYGLLVDELFYDPKRKPVKVMCFFDRVLASSCSRMNHPHVPLLSSLIVPKPRGMGTLTKLKGGGMRGVVSIARQLGLPKGCGILVGVTSSFERSPMEYWAGPRLFEGAKITSLGRDLYSIGRWNGLVTTVLEIIREDNARGGGDPPNCWHMDRKAQAQLRGGGERVTTDGGMEGTQMKDLGRAQCLVHHTLHFPPPIKKVTGCGGGIRYDPQAGERTRFGSLGDGPLVKNAASTPPKEAQPHGVEHSCTFKQHPKNGHEGEKHQYTKVGEPRQLQRTFETDLEVCLGVLWRDVVKWSRVRDSWSEGSVRFDIVVKAHRARGLQVLRMARDRRSFHLAKGKLISAIDHIVMNQCGADLLISGAEGGKSPLFQRTKINEVRDEIRLSNRWEALENLDCSNEDGVELAVKSFVDISINVASNVGVVVDASSKRPRSGFRVSGRIKRLIQERRRCFKGVLKAKRGSS
eukprot:Gb_38969 [translate_table: standard]